MSEWVRGSLGELASGVRGVSYTPSQLQRFMSPETVVLLRSNNIKDGQVNFDNVQLVPSHIVSNEQLAQHGDIAVCMSNGSKALVGKSGRIEGNEAPCTVGAFCSIFRPHAHADEKFVSYVFQSGAYRRHLDIILAGSAINNLRNSDVEELSLEIPPRQEQRLIARILDTLDTQIQKTEALIAKLEKVKEGLLHDLLTRGIDENGRLRPSPEQAPELYKESPLGLIPREWEQCTVGGLGSWKGGSTPSKSNPGFWPESGILWVSPKDLVGDEIDETEDKISELAAHSSNLFVFPAGSVLVVFRSGILRERLPVVRVGKNFTVNQDLKALIPSEGVAEEFVKYLLQGNADRILMKSVKTGTTVESLDYKFFSSYEVALPRKLEQHKISKIMKNIEGRINSERDLIKKLKKDKAGLMDDLLTGRVRVTPLLEKDQATTPA